MEDTSITKCFIAAEPRCIFCKEHLKYPIRNVENVGSFCETCFDKSAYIHRRRSQELEYVMVNLLMPCKFSYRGCNEKGTVLEISRHEKKCNYRDKICPYYGLKQCSVADHMLDFIHHFSTFHTSRIRISDNNSIDLTYKIDDETLDEFWVLAFEDDNALLNIKQKNDKLYYLIYYIGNTDNIRHITCKIQHRNDDICTNEKACSIIPERELGSVENEGESGSTFKKSVLMNYFGDSLNTTITLERDILNTRNDDILLRLECPICSNFMRTNIKQCIAGHSVCNECESKLDKCPTCTLPFYGARNFALESVGDLLKGLVRGEKLECPMRKQLLCLWKGSQTDVVEHIKDSHRDKIIVNKSLRKDLEYVAEFSGTDYLMAFGQVFKIICKKDKYDDLLVVIIELIGHDEDARKYYYNICFNSSNKQTIIWYLKSKVLTRRRVEYYIDYIAIGRLVCNSQFNISYTISKNNHYY